MVHKNGPSRRMQKQGMPAPLKESLASRKRKLAAPAKSAIKKQKTLNVRANDGSRSKSQTKKQIGKIEELGSSDDSDASVGADGSQGLEENSDLDDFAMAPSGSDEEVIDSGDDAPMGVWSDDDDDSNAKETLTAANMAGLSQQLDNERAQEMADAELELREDALQTNIAAEVPEAGHAEDQDPRFLAPDLQLLRTRITETVRTLTNFKELHDPAVSRSEYTDALLKDICTYFGYSPFMAEKLFSLFSPQEALAFFDANETPRPMVIRTNTLRTHRRDLAHVLINRGVTLEPVGKWSKVGLQIFESQVPLGATPEYLAGHYILQAASSFLPVMALAPQEHERNLDMASAPGGKVTHMAALMRNTGCIFANDSNKDRAKGLIGNIHRLGVKNTIVCSYNALEFPKVMGGFDRVLLDAPCSGTGVIAKDPTVKTNRTEADLLRLPHLQKQLLLAAIDSVDHASKTGGYIVYSTCSVTVEENEQVVQYALNKRPNVRLASTGLIFGREGFTRYRTKRFHPSMKETRRYYPHAYNVDGFFVAKLKKTGPSVATGPAPDDALQVEKQNKVSSNEADAQNDRIEGDGESVEGVGEDFETFDDEADQQIIQRSLKKQLKRKGIDPRATKSKAVQSYTKK